MLIISNYMLIIRNIAAILSYNYKLNHIFNIRTKIGKIVSIISYYNTKLEKIRSSLKIIFSTVKKYKLHANFIGSSFNV